MVDILVKYSDDAEDILRFEEPASIEKISLSLYKCFNRKGVDVVSATTSVMSGKILIFTANEDGDILLNGEEPGEGAFIVAEDEPLYLVVTMMEGGVQSQQKRKIVEPWQKLPMDKLLIQVLKYFNKRSLQVQEARVVITEKQDINFSLSEDGEILVNGKLPEQGLHLVSTYQPPPPPPVVTPKAALSSQAGPVQMVPSQPAPVQPAPSQPRVLSHQLQSSEELTAIKEQMDLMMKRVRELQQQGATQQEGIIMPSADELKEFGGIAAQGAGQPGASGAGSGNTLGGGRQPKQVHANSSLASYASEYNLFEPWPEETARGITTIGYPREPRIMEYRPPGADGDIRQIVPRGTRLQALYFAAHRQGGLFWTLRDPLTKKEYAIPEICLISPMDHNANIHGDMEHAPLEHLDYMPDKPQDRVTGTLQTSSGGSPVYDKISLENLDEQVAMTAMPRGVSKSLEQMAINQVERMANPSIREQGVRPGRRPSAKMPGLPA